jgi:transposase-like protein
MPAPPPLIGSYAPPSVRKGERVTCLYRDAECVVTAISTAPIQWPRVRAVEHRGGSGLWVNETLVRAIRTESATTLQHWFGVTAGVVWRWRKAFGVGGHATTKGSRRAIRTAAQAGAATVKAKVWTLAELRAKSVTSRKLGLKPTGRWNGREWTPEQLALLGTDHDEAIARRIGRSRSAVTTQRVQRGIPAFSGWTGGGRAWTAEEVALVGTLPDREVADRIGRTLKAVQNKRASMRLQ